MIFNHLLRGFNVALPALFLIICFHYCKALDDGLKNNPDININVDNPKHAVWNRYNISLGTTKILIKDIPQDDGFFLIQVHSFAQKVTLTNDTSFNLQRSVSGSDVGLVKILLPSDATKTFPFYLRANHSGMVLIAVNVYSSADPIPGGCSMTFNTDIAPYLNLTYTNALIEVNYQASSIFGHYCEESEVNLEMYRLYVQPNDLRSDTYFHNIQKMLSVDDIRKNGENITDSGGPISSLRRFISGYMGLGQIIVVVGVVGDRASAYVPAVTYSCDITNESDSCYDYNFTWWTILTMILLISGIILLIAEDWVGLPTVFCLFVGTSTYTVYVALIYTNVSTVVLTVIMVGYIISCFIFGCITFACVLKGSGGDSRFSDCIVSILCGFCIGALTVTGALPDNSSSSVCLGIFIATSAVVFILIFGMTYVNPFGYNLLAVFIILTSFSYIAGSNFHYLVTELLRYIIVDNYDEAVKFNLYGLLITQLIVFGVFFAMLRTICRKEEGRPRIVIRFTTSRRRAYMEYSHI